MKGIAFVCILTMMLPNLNIMEKKVSENVNSNFENTQPINNSADKIEEKAIEDTSQISGNQDEKPSDEDKSQLTNSEENQETEVDESVIYKKYRDENIEISHEGSLNSGLKWWIDAEGVLYIGSGKISASQTYSPWKEYAQKIKKIIFFDLDLNGLSNVIAGEDITYIFSGLINVESIENIGSMNTTNTKSMAYLFSNMDSLNTLDLSEWTTSNVTNMNGVFENDIHLEVINLSTWDVSKVSQMSKMFSNVKKMETLNLKNFHSNTNNLNASNMFSGMETLKVLDISNFSKPNSQMEIFSNLKSLEKIILSKEFQFTDRSGLIDEVYWRKTDGSTEYYESKIFQSLYGNDPKLTAGEYGALKREKISLLDSPLMTSVNEEGYYVSGKPFSETDELVALRYQGIGDIKEDVFINEKSWDGARINLMQGDKIRIDNIGVYKGKPIFGEITVNNSEGIVVDASKYDYLQILALTGENIKGFEVSLKIYDSESNLITTDILLPILKKTATNNSQIIYSSEKLENVITFENNDHDKLRVDKYYDKVKEFGFFWEEGNVARSDFNLFYRNISEIKGMVDDEQRIMGFFDRNSKIAMPLPYQMPTVEGKNNQENSIIKGEIVQFLPQQPTPENYEAIDLTIDYSGTADLNSKINKIKIIDKRGVDFTEDKRISTTIENGKLVISFPKEVIQEIGTGGDNTLSIMLDIAVNEEEENILNIYQADDQKLHTQIKVQSSLFDREASDTAISSVSKPTAMPVESIVTVGSTTEELNLEEMLTELKGSFWFDSVEIVGTTESKKFDIIGMEEVTIKIKSKLFGIENTVTVPLIVEDYPENYVIVPERISLEKNEFNNKIESKEEIFYKSIPNSNASIKISTSPKFVIWKNNDKATVSVKREGSEVSNGVLGVLNKENSTLEFNLEAKSEDFTLVGQYIGEITFNFDYDH